MERGLTFADVTSAFRRRAWILALTFLIGMPLSLAIAYVLPPVYQSSATILIESSQIPETLARSTVIASAAERLQQIEQRLMSRENLLGVIERLDLYADRPEMTPTDKVNELRDSITILSGSNPFAGRSRRRGGGPISTFTITFEADRAKQAALVANEFITMVIERNLESRNSRVTETNEFFKSELERLASDLLEIEARISAYKRENADALPESLQFRHGALAAVEQRMFDRQQRRSTLEESKRTLEEALVNGDSPLFQRQLSADERQLQILERNYAEQRTVYAESHPTMRALSTRIDVLRRSINPTVAGGISFREAQIKQQIKDIDAELVLLSEQRVADQARKAALEASIAKTPEVEMALGAMVRRHAGLQIQHSQALSKQTEAETGEKLEVNRQSERFEVIEQAQEPDAPAAPNRLLIAAGGSFGSVVLGIALMVLAEMLNNAIRTPRDLEMRLKLRPVVTIPFIQTAVDIHRRRLRMAGVVLAVLVILPGGLYAVDKYYLPLPLLAERLIDRTGLDEVLRLIEQRF